MMCCRATHIFESINFLLNFWNIPIHKKWNYSEKNNEEIQLLIKYEKKRKTPIFSILAESSLATRRASITI